MSFWCEWLHFLMKSFKQMFSISNNVWLWLLVFKHFESDLILVLKWFEGVHQFVWFLKPCVCFWNDGRWSITNVFKLFLYVCEVNFQNVKCLFLFSFDFLDQISKSIVYLFLNCVFTFLKFLVKKFNLRLIVEILLWFLN